MKVTFKPTVDERDSKSYVSNIYIRVACIIQMSGPHSYPGVKLSRTGALSLAPERPYRTTLRSLTMVPLAIGRRHPTVNRPTVAAFAGPIYRKLPNMADEDQSFEDRIEVVLDTLQLSDRNPDDIVRAAEECAEITRQQDVAENGRARPIEELLELAYTNIFKLSKWGRKVPPLRGLNDDEDMAKSLASLSGEKDFRGAVLHVTKAINGLVRARNPPRWSRESVCRYFHHRYARHLAVRAYCLINSGAYGQAIEDCEEGLNVARSTPDVKRMLVTKFVLEATLALSKLKTGDVDLFKASFNDVLATILSLPSADHGSNVAGLVKATVDSLKASHSLLMKVENQNPGLDRSQLLYSLCPGSFEASLDLLKELRSKHKYQQVVGTFEHWAFWAIHRGDLFSGELNRFAPGPPVPVEIIAVDDSPGSDGSGRSTDPLLTVSVEKVRLHATDTNIFPPEMVPLYLIALHMTGQRDKGWALLAGVVTNHAFEVCVLASLEERDTGDEHFRLVEYDEALEAFQASSNALFYHHAQHNSAHACLKAILDYKIGLCLSKQEKYDAALNILEQCITCIPDYMEALQLRAVCHWKLGNLDHAISDCENFVAKRDNAAAHKFPTIVGITFPNGVKESSYRDVKATLETLKEEKSSAVGRSQTPMAEATNQSRANRDLPTGSSR